MCGRYTLAHSMEEIIEAFKVQQLLLPLEPRYNIAPSQMVPIIFTAQDGDEDAKPGERIIRAARWGFIPEWVKDTKKFPPMINARGETIAEKNSYRHAFRRRRCIIPADGFYEWQGQGKERLPYRIELKGAPLFAFAGLYEDWTSSDGSMIRTNVIITVATNRLLSQFHERMPAILHRGEEDQWLDVNAKQENLAEVQALLRPYPNEEMHFFRVSKRVNGTTFNDAELSRRLAEGEAEYQAPPKEKTASREKAVSKERAEGADKDGPVEKPAKIKKSEKPPDDSGATQLKLF